MGGCCVNGCVSQPEHGVKMFSIMEDCKKAWGNTIKPGWNPLKIANMWGLCKFIIYWFSIFMMQIESDNELENPIFVFSKLSINETIF